MVAARSSSFVDSSGDRWVEISRRQAVALSLVILMKGMSHKYLRRVPTGKFTKTGKPRYRYYYNITKGRGMHEYVQGAAFKMKDKGKQGHFHITEEHDDGHVTIKHDESGREQRIHRDELHARLDKEHAKLAESEIAADAEKKEHQKKAALKDLSEARKVDPEGKKKYAAAAKKRAERLGATDDETTSAQEKKAQEKKKRDAAEKEEGEKRAKAEREKKDTEAREKKEREKKERKPPPEKKKVDPPTPSAQDQDDDEPSGELEPSGEDEPSGEPEPGPETKEKDDGEGRTESGGGDVPGAERGGSGDGGQGAAPDKRRARKGKPDAGEVGGDGEKEGGGKQPPKRRSRSVKVDPEVEKDLDAAGVPKDGMIGPVPPIVEAIIGADIDQPPPGAVWEPPASPAIQEHREFMPVIGPHTEIGEHLKTFPHPDLKKDMTVAHAHQVEAAQRCLASWDVRDGFLISDDPGLGKTLTGMLTLLANKEKNGSERHLIVVPDANKDALYKQWAHDAALYGVNIERRPPLHAEEKGFFLVSYQELQGKALGADNKKVGSKNLHERLAEGFDAVVFDEAHNMKNCSHIVAGKAAGVGANLALDLQAKSKKALYLTATPYTDVKDLRYLTKMGLFHDDNTFAEFAKLAGATVVKSKGKDGVEHVAAVHNPASTVPMATVAAMFHAEGYSVKRITNMDGLTTNVHRPTTHDRMAELHEKYKEHTVSKEDAVKTFDLADKIFEDAVKTGVFGKGTGSTVKMWKTGWSKAYWESCKIGEAIELAESRLKENPNAQVAFFSSFKDAARHSHLHRLAAKANENAEKMDEESPGSGAQMRAFAARTEERMRTMPVPKNPVDALTAYFGAGNVAKVYGSHNGTKEQELYQDGHRKILVATMDKGGTGLSFHDTVGGRPRTQINLSLPYTATKFAQVAGRSHRLGSKSDTEMTWLTGDGPTEMKNAATVVRRSRSMGSLVKGDPSMMAGIDQILKTMSAREVRAFENGTDDDEGEAAENAENAEETPTPVVDEEAEETRKWYMQALNEYHAGDDALGKRKAERDARQLATKERDVRRMTNALSNNDNLNVYHDGKGTFHLHGPMSGWKRNSQQRTKYAEKIKAAILKEGGEQKGGTYRMTADQLLSFGKKMKRFDEKAHPYEPDSAYSVPEHYAKLQGPTKMKIPDIIAMHDKASDAGLNVEAHNHWQDGPSASITPRDDHPTLQASDIEGTLVHHGGSNNPKVKTAEELNRIVDAVHADTQSKDFKKLAASRPRNNAASAEVHSLASQKDLYLDKPSVGSQTSDYKTIGPDHVAIHGSGTYEHSQAMRNHGGTYDRWGGGINTKGGNGAWIMPSKEHAERAIREMHKSAGGLRLAKAATAFVSLFLGTR